MLDRARLRNSLWGCTSGVHLEGGGTKGPQKILDQSLWKWCKSDCSYSIIVEAKIKAYWCISCYNKNEYNYSYIYYRIVLPLLILTPPPRSDELSASGLDSNLPSKFIRWSLHDDNFILYICAYDKWKEKHEFTVK